MELDIPIIAHTGRDVPLSAFNPLLDRIPELRLVCAHAGGAGWRDAAAFARRHEAVVFDLSELLWWAGAGDAPNLNELVDLVLEIGPDRLMFGSDFPWYEPLTGLQQLHALGLSDILSRLITGDTAVRTFRLAGSPTTPPKAQD